MFDTSEQRQRRRSRHIIPGGGLHAELELDPFELQLRALIIRFARQEAFALGVEGISDQNIVDITKRDDARPAARRSEIAFGASG